MDKKKVKSFKTAGIMFLVSGVLFILGSVLFFLSGATVGGVSLLGLTLLNLGLGAHQLSLFNQHKHLLK